MKRFYGKTLLWAGTLGILLHTMAVAFPTDPPLPPPRPDRAADPAPEPPPGPAEPSVQAKPEDAPTGETCPDRLTRLGVRFEARDNLQEGVCNVQEPVLVTALPDGVELAPASLMRCSMAEGLAQWSTDVLKPEAERHLQTSVSKLLIGTSYQCRNQRSGGKLSEHAFGNGVDIMGFAFPERPPLNVAFQAKNSSEEAFQSAVQKGACTIFKTVLGPGSDAAHGDHLHLDMRVRKRDYRICQ